MMVIVCVDKTISMWLLSNRISGVDCIYYSYDKYETVTIVIMCYPLIGWLYGKCVLFKCKYCSNCL